MLARTSLLLLAIFACQLPSVVAQESDSADGVKAEVDHLSAEQDHSEAAGHSSGSGGHAEGDGHGDDESHGDEHGSDSHAGGGHGDSHSGDSHSADSHGEGHGDAHGGNTNPLSVDPDLMVFTGIIFCLLLAVLSKFAWGPIRDSLDQREKGIEEQIAEAHRSNEEARRLLAEHEEKVSKASEEVREMLDQARRDAESQKANILAEAEAAAKAEKDRAVREIHAAKNNALEQLAESSVDQALGLAGSIVGQKLEKQDHARLIQDALKQIPSEN